jgi:GntR family transcriptional regulator, transcriptional repressor for pyruvate dehydrogenase complex
MEAHLFEPVQTTRISDHIQKKIKDAILDGRLKSGDHLPTEKKMAEQFRVSVVTLREALRALESFGLIEKRKGKGGGNFVSQMDQESVKSSLGCYLSFQHLTYHHLLEVRTIIEPSIIRLAVDKFTDEKIQELEENVAYCEKRYKEVVPFLTDADFLDLDQKNVDFHRLLAKVPGNPVLSLTVDYVFAFLYDCEKEVLAPDAKFIMDNTRDHRIILDHLKLREWDQAERTMVEHLKTVNKTLAAMGERRRLNVSEVSPAVRDFQEKIGLGRSEA